MKYCVVFICSLFFFYQNMYSQSATIRGTVVDTAGRPLSNALVIIKEKNIEYKTDKNGFYEIIVPAEKNITLSVRLELFKKYEYKFKLGNGEVKMVNIILNPSKNEIGGAIIKGTTKELHRTQVSSYEVEIKEEMVNPTGSLEAVLKFIPGVSGNNELSSGYSVRGGNYDENLVYVNDFEVYRPYLMRAGQQEGLSFANPNLVKNIKFSTGGFQPKYGDKMSSVLDITYKKPTKMAASGELSLMGGSMHLEGASKNRHLTFLMGVRQRSAQYLLGTLDTKGQYLPSFSLPL